MSRRNADPNAGFLLRAQKPLIIAVVGYLLAACGLLSIPAVQRHIVFDGGNSNASLPIGSPAQYGFTAAQYREVKISTPDNVNLGAWLFFSSIQWSQIPTSNRDIPFTDQEVTEGLGQNVNVLYLHDTGVNRAAPDLIQLYETLSGFPQANILVVDYRGSGGSEGSASAENIVTDARSAWDWLVSHGAKPQDVVVMGQGVGSVVAAALVSELEEQSVLPRGLALIAPVPLSARLIESYSAFGGLLPPFSPLVKVPYMISLLARLPGFKFDLTTVINALKTPIVIVHAEDDLIVPTKDLDELWKHIVEPHLPPWAYKNASFTELFTFSREEFEVMAEVTKARVVKAKEITVVGDYAFKYWQAPSPGVLTELMVEDGRMVTWLELKEGGHSQVVRSNATIDFLASSLRLR